MKHGMKVLELEGPMILSCLCSLSLKLRSEKLSVLAAIREMKKKHQTSNHGENVD